MGTVSEHVLTLSCDRRPCRGRTHADFHGATFVRATDDLCWKAATKAGWQWRVYSNLTICPSCRKAEGG